MPFKVSFVVDDEEKATAFVTDAAKTDNLICWTDANGNDHEWQVGELRYEKV
jgi:hypothetical protein